MIIERGYLYVIPPIDWWEGGMESDRMAEIFDKNDSIYRELTPISILDKVAKESAYNSGWWEGDTNNYEGDSMPLWGVVPGIDGTLARWCGWKQANNGTTFIFSEIILPHLVSGAFFVGCIRYSADDGKILSTSSTTGLGQTR
jgi:hypothetical protein